MSEVVRTSKPALDTSNARDGWDLCLYELPID
jgi:hypothetical protein